MPDGRYAEMVAVVDVAAPATMWGYAPPSGGLSNTTAAVTIKAAGSAGIRNYISAIQIMAEALTAATELVIRDGAGGTVLWRTKIGVGGLTGGASVALPRPIRGSVATLVEMATLTATITGAVYVNVQGYQAA